MTCSETNPQHTPVLRPGHSEAPSDGGDHGTRVCRVEPCSRSNPPTSLLIKPTINRFPKAGFNDKPRKKLLSQGSLRSKLNRAHGPQAFTWKECTLCVFVVKETSAMASANVLACFAKVICPSAPLTSQWPRHFIKTQTWPLFFGFF